MTPGGHERSHACTTDFQSLKLVASPRSARTLAVLLLVLLAVIVGGLVVTPWQQTSTGSGRVVAYAPLERQQFVEAPIDGRIMHWYVAEGSRVQKGDKIADMSDNDPMLLERLSAEKDAVMARLEAARMRASALEERIISLRESKVKAIAAAQSRTRMAVDRVTAAQHALEAAEGAQKTAELNLTRQKSLGEEGLTSTRAIELAELEALRSVTDTQRAKAALSGAKGEELAIASDQEKVTADTTAAINDAQAGLAAARAEVANTSAELMRMESRLARQMSQEIRAPRTGTILRLLRAQGTVLVKAGEALAVLIPDTEDRAVELWIDGNDMPLVSDGRRVRLQFEGWPALQFSGWPSVAVGTFGGYVKLIDATDDGTGQFRVVVLPDPKEPWPRGKYLRQGVRANGWILLNRVPLGYELWRQFNSFPPVVAPQDPDDPNAKKKKEKKPYGTGDLKDIRESATKPNKEDK
jgi:adhesin transport system membrane fusion protein